MTTIQKIIAGICIMAVPFISSCGKDDPVNCNWFTEVQDELDAVNAASTAWSLDPSNTVKCNAYKTAYQNYLNELEDHKSCVPDADAAALQQSIDAAQLSIDGLQC